MCIGFNFKHIVVNPKFVQPIDLEESNTGITSGGNIYM